MDRAMEDFRSRALSTVGSAHASHIALYSGDCVRSWVQIPQCPFIFLHKPNDGVKRAGSEPSISVALDSLESLSGRSLSF
jgi:hypothetical protein